MPARHIQGSQMQMTHRRRQVVATQALRNIWFARRAPVLECDLQQNARMTRSASVAAETAAPSVRELGYGAPVVRPDRAISCVLVVDDNAENRALAKATLEDEDIPVVLASTGEEAIAAFARAPADCVLLDIRMPGMDGITVCARI